MNRIGFAVGWMLVRAIRYWMWVWPTVAALLLQDVAVTATHTGRRLDFSLAADVWRAETLWVAVTMALLGGAIVVGGSQRAMHAWRGSWEQSGYFGNRFAYIVAPFMLGMSLYAAYIWKVAGVHDWRNGLILAGT